MKTISKNKYFTLALILIVFIQCQSEKHEKTPMVLLCAAGMTDVASEICDSFELKNEVKININFASSGILARQIEQGSRGDIFISASKQWADYIDSLGKVAERKILFKNRLALIAPKTSLVDSIRMVANTQLSDYISHRIAIGDPEHVPAGTYAKEALVYLGWYTNIADKILPTKDVRSALMMVELGECDLGIVYISDALKSENVKIVGVFPEETHSNINFHALLFKDSSELAKKLYDHLNDTSVISIWLKNGLEKI